jgi:glycerol-3-phosphate dehydrogenase (NAD(P)+)
VAIIGDGQMGLVLAMLLAEKRHKATIWGPFPADLQSLSATRLSPRLPGFRLPAAVEVEPDLHRAVEGADFVVAAIPTQFLRDVWEGVARCLLGRVIVASVAKGIEERSLRTPLAVIEDSQKRFGIDRHDPLVCVSGPTIASELARRRPATVVAASNDPSAARSVQELLTTSWLRVYTNDDVIGVELAGATKNVIALAAGIVDGLELGYNAKSALLARGLAEIARLGIACGARAETFFGIAGVGDLATTCFSPSSRNRTCGERLGSGESLEQILATTASVIEGIATTRSTMALATQMRVDMPITRAIHGILFEQLPPRDAIALLMEREPKAEIVG